MGVVLAFDLDRGRVLFFENGLRVLDAVRGGPDVVLTESDFARTATTLYGFTFLREPWQRPPTDAATAAATFRRLWLQEREDEPTVNHGPDRPGYFYGLHIKSAA